jgi:hypothetical protein
MSKRKKKKRTLHLPHMKEPVDDKGWSLAPLLDQDQASGAYRQNTTAGVLI